MGAIHNDLFCWANKARAQGRDRIELDVDTALKVSEMLMDNAAKIDELKDEVAQLKDALKPFAEKSARLDKACIEMGFEVPPDTSTPHTSFTHGQLRRARSALPLEQ